MPCVPFAVILRQQSYTISRSLTCLPIFPCLIVLLGKRSFVRFDNATLYTFGISLAQLLHANYSSQSEGEEGEKEKGPPRSFSKWARPHRHANRRWGAVLWSFKFERGVHTPSFYLMGARLNATMLSPAHRRSQASCPRYGQRAAPCSWGPTGILEGSLEAHRSNRGFGLSLETAYIKDWKCIPKWNLKIVIDHYYSNTVKRRPVIKWLHGHHFLDLLLSLGLLPLARKWVFFLCWFGFFGQFNLFKWLHGNEVILKEKNF